MHSPRTIRWVGRGRAKGNTPAAFARYQSHSTSPWHVRLRRRCTQRGRSESRGEGSVVDHEEHTFHFISPALFPRRMCARGAFATRASRATCAFHTTNECDYKLSTIHNARNSHPTRTSRCNKQHTPLAPFSSHLFYKSVLRPHN